MEAPRKENVGVVNTYCLLLSVLATIPQQQQINSTPTDPATQQTFIEYLLWNLYSTVYFGEGNKKQHSFISYYFTID